MECDSTRVVTCAGPGAYGSETFSSRVEGDLAAQFCQRTTSRWQSWMRRGGLRWRTCASRPRAEGRRWGWQEVPNSRQSPTAVSGGHVPATPIFPEGHRIVYVLICMLRRQFTHAAAWVAFVATGPRPLSPFQAAAAAHALRRRLRRAPAHALLHAEDVGAVARLHAGLCCERRTLPSSFLQRMHRARLLAESSSSKTRASLRKASITRGWRGRCVVAMLVSSHTEATSGWKKAR